MSLLKQAEPVPSLSTSRLPGLVSTLAEFFASRQVSAYLVGGVLRDALLDRVTEDVDLAVAGDTRAVGTELSDLLGGRSILLDEARDIVRVVMPGSGRGPVIDLSPLPDNIHADLSRRDFTIDAMAVPISEVRPEVEQVPLIDPHHGVRDLNARVIRALSPSVFTADGARLMRAPRLAAELGFSIAGETARAIRRHARLVLTVAPERVRNELLRLLARPSATSSLRLLDDLGLLCLIIPELAEARGVTQPREHHWDVFDHCIETAGQVERLIPGTPSSEVPPFVTDAIPRFKGLDEHFAREASDGHNRLTTLKLAGLLHDIAKPATRTVESSGRIRFLGHPDQGAQMSAQIMARLRFSRRSIDLVSSMVEQHLRPSQMSQDGELPSKRAVYRYYRDAGDAAIDTLYLNMADYLAARGPLLRKREWADHCRTIEHILRGDLEPKSDEGPPKLIDGHDLLKTFSLTPGPIIGLILEQVREAQAGGDITSRDGAIELVKSKLSTGAGNA